jgi:hypothetical protein
VLFNSRAHSRDVARRDHIVLVKEEKLLPSGLSDTGITGVGLTSPVGGVDYLERQVPTVFKADLPTYVSRTVVGDDHFPGYVDMFIG